MVKRSGSKYTSCKMKLFRGDGEEWMALAVTIVRLFAISSAGAVTASSDAIAEFSCKETAQSELVDMLNCHMTGNDHEVSCFYGKKHPKTNFTVNLSLLPQEFAPTPANSTNITLCLTQDTFKWTYEEIKFFMEFSHSLVVGVAVMDKSCLHRNKSLLCEKHIKFRKEIADLPIMNFVPENPEFWNFTSPLFGQRYNWFLKFSMTKSNGVVNPETAVHAFQGTSVNTIVLRGWKKGPKQLHPLPPLINMSSLENLEIYYNLNVRYEEFFSGTPNLRYLILHKISLVKVPSSMGKAKRLIKVSLVHNKIQHIPQELSHLQELETLELDWNKINKLDSLPNLPNLWFLSIRYCEITTLKPRVFQNLPSLQIIKLDGNPLLFLRPMAFGSLPRLKEISMNQCSLPGWPTQALRGLHLETLNLRKNFLWKLGNLGAVGTSVEHLIVSHNRVQEWNDPEMFECRRMHLGITGDSMKNKNQTHILPSPCFNGSWVQSLLMDNNLIRTITASMRESLNVVRKIDLTGNPIDCSDCGTPELQQWLRRSTEKLIMPLRCKAPAWASGTPVVSLEFDPLPCLEPLRTLLLNVVMPVLVVTSVVTAVGATLFLYRVEIAYLRHLIRIRHNSKPSGDRSQDSGHTFDAFVCYSGKNRKWVLRRLALLLERKPEYYRLCLFDRDFRLGTHIVTNIVDAIDQSRKVIVVLTKHFIESKWCQWEMEMANHKLFGEDREFLVLLELERLDHQHLPRLLRFLLATRPVVRWPRPETASNVRQAAALLRRALGPSLSQRPSPGPVPNTHSTPENQAIIFYPEDWNPILHDEPASISSEANEQTPLLQNASSIVWY